MIGIYFIKNLVNFKNYVGSSINIQKRWTRHKYDLNSKNHINSHLQNAWHKYGQENFEFGILEECDKNHLEERELFWITKLDTFNNGYNLLFQCSRPIMTDRVRKNKSISAKKLWKDENFRQKTIVTMIENRRTNPTENRKNGYKNSGLSRRDKRKVGQFDLNGNLEKIFQNRREAFLFYNKSRNFYRVLDKSIKTFKNKKFEYLS